MRLKLGMKLGVGFGVILALMILSAALSYWKSEEITSIEATILKTDVPSIQASRRLQDNIDYAGAKTRQAILAGSEPARYQDAQTRFDDAWRRIDSATASLDKLAPQWSKQENRDLLVKIKDGLPKVKSAQWGTVETARSGAREAVVQGGNDYADKITPINDGITKSLGQLADGFDKTLDGERGELAAAHSAMNWTMSVAALTGIITGGFVAFWMGRSISRSTHTVLTRAEAIAAGT